MLCVVIYCFAQNKKFLRASSTKTTPFSKQSLRSIVFSKCHGLGRAASIMKDNEFDSPYSHLVSSELLNPNQSGFRPGDSTINQLISMTHTIFGAFDYNPPLDVRSVYLDISKAFDGVWHDGLIYKLKRCGVSG